MIGYLVAPGEPAPFESPGSRETAHRESAPAKLRRAGEIVARSRHARRDRSEAAASRPAPGASRASWASTGSRLDGSGKTGRIGERDVRAAARARPASSAEPRSHAERTPMPADYRRDRRQLDPQDDRRADGPERSRRRPRSRSRRPSTPRTWSTSGSNSRRWPAPARAPVDRLHRHRRQADGAGAREHPMLNARWNGDRILVCRSDPHRDRRRYRGRPAGPGDPRRRPARRCASSPPARGT